MKAADVLRNLIKTMGSGNPELDEALRISALAYLDKLDPPPEQSEQKPEQKDEKPEQKPEKTSSTPKKKKQSKIDTEGGWTLAGIAREMGCSQQTVANHLKKMGMK